MPAVSLTRYQIVPLEVLLGSDYTQDETFGVLPTILSQSNFTKDPSIVTDVELTAHMTDGPEASESLLRKKKKPKTKKTPSETKATPPPLPTGETGQSHSVFLGTQNDPKDSKRNIQIADRGLPSTHPDDGTRKSQTLLEGTNIDPKDLVGNIQPIGTGLPSTVLDEDTDKTTHLSEGPLGDKYSGGNKPPADMEPINLTKEEILEAGKEMDTNPQAALIETQSSPVTEQPLSPPPQSTEHQPFSPLKDRHESSKAPDAATATESSNAEILLKDDHKTQTDKLDAVKEDHVLNKKVIEATESYTKNYVNLTEFLTLVKGFNFSDLMSAMTSIHNTLNNQDTKLSKWTKSRINQAWNLGSRLAALEHSQAAVRNNFSAIKQDTVDIKSIMVKMYQDFKGQSVSPSSISVTSILALTHIAVNVKGENDANTTTEEPPSHTEGETKANETEKEHPEEPKESSEANIEHIDSSTPHSSETPITHS
ncbi:hypothetical protein Tco_0401672 [Tanacetum coccineum]